MKVVKKMATVVWGFILVAAVIIIIALFCGLDIPFVKSDEQTYEEYITEKWEKELANSMFGLVEAKHDWAIVYAKDTDVMYSVSKGGNGNGVFAVLVNADGTPMLYGG